MNAVIYARYSSSNQSELSIEGQLKVCHEYAAHHGHTVMAEYIDRAVSGTGADNRLEFQNMIAASESGDFQIVLVYQLDRFARNRYDSATYKAKLKHSGVRVISARETITDDASGILMEAMLEGMAEYYSCELSQKVRRGLAINANKGIYTGAGIPLGYIIKDKHFVICKKTAPIVLRIFDLYLDGHSMGAISRLLNQRGIKTKRGNPYNKCAIRRILRNPRYMGIYRYGSVELAGMVPPLVDADTFRSVQLRMEQNRTRHLHS